MRRCVYIKTKIYMFAEKQKVKVTGTERLANTLYIHICYQEKARKNVIHTNIMMDLGPKCFRNPCDNTNRDAHLSYFALFIYIYIYGMV